MLAPSSSAQFAHAHLSTVGLLRAFVDPTLIGMALLLSCAVSGVDFAGAELLLLLLAFVLSFPGEATVERVRRGLAVSIVSKWIVIVAILGFLGYATRFLGHFNGRMLATWVVVTPVLQYAAHRVIAALLPQLMAMEGVRRAVVVSMGDSGRKVAQQLTGERGLGYRFVGYFDDDEGPAGSAEAEWLGTIDDVADQVKRRGIDVVFLALPLQSQPRLLGLLDQMKDTTASIYFVPDIFVFDLIQARIDDVNGLPVLAVCETPFVGWDGLIKRGSDLVVATLLLAWLWPLMLVAALGVRLSSPGPILFRQRRYGVDGREIVVLKFRTMTVLENDDHVTQARADDRRVTRWGSWLRRTSADELPQLFNVLRGSMSMVGPRPHAVAHNELYRRQIKGYMVRHKVKPGITGWAQVNGLRGETDTIEKMQRRIEFDLDYLRRWSLGFDLLILWRTVRTVLSRTNAY